MEKGKGRNAQKAKNDNMLISYKDEKNVELEEHELHTVFLFFFAAHCQLLQQAEWHHGERGQSRLLEKDFKLANLRLFLL